MPPRKRKCRVSTSGVPSPPYCLLCGVESRELEDEGSVEKVIRNRWKVDMASGSRSNDFLVPSKEIEAMCLPESPDLCSYFFRAIIKDPLSSEYCLTGINLWDTPQGNLIFMPRNVNIGRIGSKASKTQYSKHRFTRCYVAAIDTPPDEFDKKKLAFTIHAHCWALLDHISHITLGEAKLHQFVRAAQQYWLLRDHDITWSESKFFGSAIHRSPFVLPKIQNAIERAKVIESNTNHFHFTNLPLEVSILIVQLVCPVDYASSDVDDTCNMLSAFRWTIPKSFWISRLDERLFFELGLLETTFVNWQSVCLELMSLFCDKERRLSSGLANRERVLGLIDAILEC